MSFGINANANVISQGASDTVANMGVTDSSSQWPVNNFNGAFQNAGQGYVLFTITTSQPANNTSNTWNISEVKVYTGQSYGNPNSQYICDIGTTNYYIDSNKEIVIYSVKCPVNLNNNTKLLFVEARRLITGYVLGINISTIYTFVSEQSDANAIISANQQAIQQQINAENANSQAIQNAINTATQNEINAINSATQATQDNTQAINDIKDYDVKNGDGESSKPDTSNIQGEQTAQNNVTGDIEYKLQNLQRPTWNFNSFRTSFTWIWTTFDTIINCNNLLFVTLIIMLSIGLIKLTLGR